MLTTRNVWRRRRVFDAAAVLVCLSAPLAVAAWSGRVALRTVERAQASAADAEQLLVGLAAALCALACGHLFLLVAAGVSEGLRCTRHRGASPAARPSRTSGWLPGRAVRVAVAALVIGTSTVPAAYAGTPGERPPAAAEVDPAAVPADPTGAAPGTWSALAEQAAPEDGARPQGFVPAPAPPAPSTADLVTAPRVRTTVRDAAEPVVVVAGSSLWSIAADHLGPGATDTEVAEAWPRWWLANRDIIGADPHLLLPGQQLVPPGADGS